MEKTKNQKKAYFLTLLVIVFWSTVASAFKISLRNLDFLHLLLISNFTAIAVLLFTLLITGKFHLLFSYSIKYHSRSVILGFLNPYLYYIILFKAYSILPAQIAQPLNFTWPIVLTLMSVPLLGQKISARSIIAIFVCFIGVFFVSAQGMLIGYKLTDPAGMILAVSSSVIWSLFWIYNIRDRRDDEVKLFMNFLFSGIYILITCIIFSDLSIVLSAGFYAAIYVGLFEMGITYIIWIKALQMSGGTDRLASFVYITPFLSLIFIHFVLHEAIFFTSIIGLILIVLGILVQRLR